MQVFLAKDGVEVCRNKVKDLSARGIGRGAILLSSASPRAVLTTRELRQQLGIHQSYKSRYITAVGTRPAPVQNLHDFTEKVLAGCGVETESNDVLLIVHQPLVTAVDSDTGDGITQVPDNWINPVFDPDFAFIVEDSAQ
jgi:hypothetical protein